MSEGRTEEACRKFEGAAQLSQTPGVRLNLSECFARLGRTASAWARYGEALALAERAGDQEAAEVARKGRAAIEPRLSYLIVSVPPQVVVAGLQITRDGENVPEAAWNSAVPVDPGEHAVAATAPGRRPWSANTMVSGDGARVTVGLPPLVLDEARPARPHAAPAAPPVVDKPAAGWQRPAALTAAALGLVGIGVGSYFGLHARSKKNDYEDHRGPDGACLDQACEDLSGQAHRSGNISTVAFAAGGVFAAAGVVLWLTAPSRTRASTSVAPVAGPHVAGLQWKGTW